MIPVIFKLIVAAHVGAGVTALTTFWVAVMARKGGAVHRRWGRLFTSSVYVAATLALAMGSLSVIAPLANHPRLTDAALYRGLFGWMMIYLALLTISMTRYGLQMIANQRDHDANRHWTMILLQAAVLVACVNCAVHGVMLRQPLMIGISAIGLGTTLTYLWYILRPAPSVRAWLPEHLKAMVATGISAYTAFLSVGLIELFPEHAFNPAIWVLPTIVGVAIIIVQLRRVGALGKRGQPAVARSSVSSSSGIIVR